MNTLLIHIIIILNSSSTSSRTPSSMMSNIRYSNSFSRCRFTFIETRAVMKHWNIKVPQEIKSPCRRQTGKFWDTIIPPYVCNNISGQCAAISCARSVGHCFSNQPLNPTLERIKRTPMKHARQMQGQRKQEAKSCHSPPTATGSIQVKFYLVW